jgi:alkaline phosphatase D
MFEKGCSAEQGENLAPCFGLQFFGRIDIDGQSEAMTVTLKDVDNTSLWSVDILPQPDARAGRMMAEHI